MASSATSAASQAIARNTQSRREAPRARILTIGDELLAGDIVDSNKATIAAFLRAHGFEVLGARSVRDRVEEIVEAVRDAAESAEVCIVSGGLGPTSDDLTAASLARAAGVGLERRPELADRLRAFFAPRGEELVQLNLRQADLPAGADVLDNPIGTAAGFALRIDDMIAFSTPGVPREMRRMLDEQIAPRLQAQFGSREVPRRVHLCLGRGESSIVQALEPVFARARAKSPGLAAAFVHYRAGYPIVRIILEATPDQEGRAASAEELASLDADIAAAVGPAWIGIGFQDLPERLVEALRERNQTLAVAESCTGGGLGAAITEVPGASACFKGGAIAYANEVKRDQLGVDASVLEAHGAVSEPVARAMAEGARDRFGSDLAVAITGIAGPEGGSPEKPVGTVDFAVADQHGTSYQRLKLRGERGTVRRAATLWAQKLLWDHLHAPQRSEN